MKYIKNNLVYILLGLIAGMVLAYFLWTPKADATFVPKVNICHFDGQSGNFQTLNIAIPAAIAHLAQHDADYPGVCEEIVYCENEEALNYKEEGDCEYPEEPTPTPTEEPKEEPKGNPSDERFAPSSTLPPGVCGVNGIGDVANINVEVGTPNDNKLEVQWSLPLNADKVHIIYGEYGKPYEHALLNTPNDGNEVIDHLKNGVNYNFKVAGVKDCGVGNYSKEFDPKP